MPAALCIQQCESGLLLLPRMQPMGRSCVTVCEAHVMDSKPWSVELPAVSHASCSRQSCQLQLSGEDTGRTA